MGTSFPIALQKMLVEEIRVGDIIEFDYEGGTHSGKRLVLITSNDSQTVRGYDLSLISDTFSVYSLDIFRCFTKSLIRNLKLFTRQIYMESLFVGQHLLEYCKVLCPDMYIFDNNTNTIIVTPFVLTIMTKNHLYIANIMDQNRDRIQFDRIKE